MTPTEALFKAARKGTVADCKAALEAGADINARQDDSWSGHHLTPDVVAARFNSDASVSRYLTDQAYRRFVAETPGLGHHKEEESAA